MEDLKKESEFVQQHINDCEKTKSNLLTMKSNISGANSEWKEIVKVRTAHCDAYIKVLKNEQKRFEHFK